jgi:hypothetical protein
VQSVRCLPTFQRNVLPSSSGKKAFHSVMHGIKLRRIEKFNKTTEERHETVNHVS